jgi:hypothetical protein
MMPQITQLDREDFLAHYWAPQPGEHVAFFEPTQQGKTYLMYQCLGRAMEQQPHLRTVTAAPKPGDPATSYWTQRLGMRVTDTWPPPWRPFSAKPPGLTLWPKHIRGATPEALKANKEHLGRIFAGMMNDQYWEGNSVTVADDAYLLVLLGMNEHFERLLTAGGGMNASIWISGQKPSGTKDGASLTSFAYNAPTHLFLGHDPDTRNQQRFSEIGGVDPKLVAEVVKQLRMFQVNGKNVSEKLYIHKGGPWMAIIGL